MECFEDFLRIFLAKSNASVSDGQHDFLTRRDTDDLDRQLTLLRQQQDQLLNLRLANELMARRSDAKAQNCAIASLR